MPYTEGEGQAHRGFYRGFQAAKPFIERYLNAFYTGEQTLVVCGHSLGGAIALLLAEWLRRKPTKPNIVLYTFGAPRAGDAAFVKAAQPLTHHRIVNHNDPVPALPLPWMDAEWKLALPGAALAYSSPVIGSALLLAGLVNLQGDLPTIDPHAVRSVLGPLSDPAVDVATLGVTYNVGNGLAVYAEGIWFDTDSETDTASSFDNEGLGLISGITVNF